MTNEKMLRCLDQALRGLPDVPFATKVILQTAMACFGHEQLSIRRYGVTQPCDQLVELMTQLVQSEPEALIATVEELSRTRRNERLKAGSVISYTFALSLSKHTAEVLHAASREDIIAAFAWAEQNHLWRRAVISLRPVTYGYSISELRHNDESDESHDESHPGFISIREVAEQLGAIETVVHGLMRELAITYDVQRGKRTGHQTNYLSLSDAKRVEQAFGKPCP